MIAIEEIKKLTKTSLAPVTVLTGDDVGQYQLAKEELFQQIGFDAGDLGYAYFDMSEASYPDVELDLVSLPFFSEEKIIVLDYFSDLTTAKKRFLTDEELKRFEQYIENPCETTRLLICVQGKLDSKRRLVKLLKRDAQLFEANEMKEADLRRYMTQKAAEMELQISPAVLEELLVKSNFDFSESSKNLAFLQAYKPKQEIEHQDIQEAIPKTLQDNLFDLTQMLIQSRLSQARELVHDLRLQGEDEIKLIAILIQQFRLFLQVKLLAEAGQSEPQMVASLSDYLGRKVNPFQVKYALRDSRSVSIGYLKRALCQLIETDYQIKTGLYEKAYLLDMALLKLATD